MIRKVGIILFIIFIILQFFRPGKNISTTISPADITQVYSVPQNVQQILQRSCADCHSNNTDYPWYASVQPVAWWLHDHIKDGKDELNFSEFGTYRIARQNKKMKEIVKEIKKGDMPLTSYAFIHRKSRLTDADKQILFDWCQSVQDSLQAKYPPDSLIIKK